MALEEAAERSRQEELKRRKRALQNERVKKVIEELNGNLNFSFAVFSTALKLYH